MLDKIASKCTRCCDEPILLELPTMTNEIASWMANRLSVSPCGDHSPAFRRYIRTIRNLKRARSFQSARASEKLLVRAVHTNTHTHTHRQTQEERQLSRSIEKRRRSGRETERAREKEGVREREGSERRIWAVKIYPSWNDEWMDNNASYGSYNLVYIIRSSWNGQTFLTWQFPSAHTYQMTNWACYNLLINLIL